MQALTTWLAADFANFDKNPEVSKTDKAFKVAGILLGSVAYLYIIKVVFDAKTCIIRRDIVAYNIVWEGLRTFVWRQDDSFFMKTLIGSGWFLLDVAIVAALLMYGDGDPAVSLGMQRVEFAAWVAIYTVVGLASKNSPSTSRVWRHASFVWATLTCMSIVRHQTVYGTPNPFFEEIAWACLLGNAAYMAAYGSLYKQWYHVGKHPVKFAMIVGIFVPTLVYNVHYVLVARQRPVTH